MRLRFRAVACATLLALISGHACADTYPDRPITIVVPFAAGGPTDAVARVIAHSMSKTLKEQIIIETVPGAGGTLGAIRVARSNPDGYTLLIHHIALAAAASLYKKLQYDPLTDFETIGLINYGPMVFIARKDFPADDAKSFFAKLKKEATNATLAHAGIGSNAHLCGLLLQQALNAKLTEVTYRGTAPAINDVMGGQVDALCDQTTNAVPQIQGNLVKAYAVTSHERLDVLSNLPTMAEAGFPGFEFVLWNGLYAPKGTPKSVIETLHNALEIALDDPAVKANFAEAGTSLFSPEELTIAAHRALLEKEYAKWRDVLTKAGVSLN